MKQFIMYFPRPNEKESQQIEATLQSVLSGALEVLILSHIPPDNLQQIVFKKLLDSILEHCVTSSDNFAPSMATHFRNLLMNLPQGILERDQKGVDAVAQGHLLRSELSSARIDQRKAEQAEKQVRIINLQLESNMEEYRVHIIMLTKLDEESLEMKSQLNEALLELRRENESLELDMNNQENKMKKIQEATAKMKAGEFQSVLAFQEMKEEYQDGNERNKHLLNEIEASSSEIKKFFK